MASLGSLYVHIGAKTQGLQKGLQTARNSLTKFSGMAKTAAGAAKRLAGSMIKLGVVAAAAVTGIGLLSIKIGKDFYHSLESVGAMAGATRGEMDKLAAKAREVGKETAFSASDAAKAMYNLASAGLSVNEILGSVTHSVKLAGATAGDMSTATQLMASSMKVFNLEADEAQRVADVFATTVKNSMFTLNQLTDTMKYAGPVAGALGWSLEETAAAAGHLKNLGLEASQVGTTMRVSMLRLSKGTDEVKKTLNKLGLELDDVNPEMNSFNDIMETLAKTTMDTSDATKIFGAEAGGAMSSLITQVREGKIELSDFNEKLAESGGKAAKMYERMMNTVWGRWEIFKSNMQETMITLFDSMREGLKSLITTMSNVVTNMRKLFKDWKPILETALIWISTFVSKLNEYFTSWVEKSDSTTKKGMTKVKENVITALGDAIEKTITFTQDLYDSFKRFQLGLSAVIGAFSIALNAIVGTVKETAGTIAGWISKIYMGLAGVYALQSKWYALKGQDEMAAKLGQNALEAINTMTDLQNISKDLGNSATKNADKIYKAQRKMMKDADEIGKEMMGSPLYGMGEKWKTMRIEIEKESRKIINAQKAVKEESEKDKEESEKDKGKPGKPESIGPALPTATQPGAGGGAGGTGPPSQSVLPHDAIMPRREAYERLKSFEQKWQEHWQTLGDINGDGLTTMEEKWKGSFDMQIETFKKFSVGIANAMAGSIANMVTATSQGKQSMGEAIGGLIGELAGMWGQYHILQGIATMAEGGWPPNPQAIKSGSKELAAGIALTAFGKAIGGGGGGGGASTGGGGPSPGGNPDKKKKDRGPLIQAPEHLQAYEPRGVARAGAEGGSRSGDTIVLNRPVMTGGKRGAKEFAREVGPAISREKTRKPSNA